MKLLKRTTKLGMVIIITNAKRGWVEFSSSLMLPKVHNFIMKFVEVISARDFAEKDYPMNT
jgi:hypothetical protein